MYISGGSCLHSTISIFLPIYIEFVKSYKVSPFPLFGLFFIANYFLFNKIEFLNKD